MALIPVPFSQAFNLLQEVILPCGEMKRVFYGKLPDNHVGFLNQLSSNSSQGVLLSWTIDGEEILHDETQFGNGVSPLIFDPPYVVHDNIEVYARNTTCNDARVEIYCDGNYYQDTPARKGNIYPQYREPAPLLPVLEEIRDTLKNEKPKGESTSELITTTDSVYELYDRQYGDLGYTSCSIINTGPDPVYFSVNKWEMPNASLGVGESANVDLGRRCGIKRLFFICESGKTATVKVHAIK